MYDHLILASVLAEGRDYCKVGNETMFACSTSIGLLLRPTFLALISAIPCRHFWLPFLHCTRPSWPAPCFLPSFIILLMQHTDRPRVLTHIIVLCIHLFPPRTCTDGSACSWSHSSDTMRYEPRVLINTSVFSPCSLFEMTLAWYDCFG